MVSAWANYGGIISEVERQLCDLNGVDDKTREKHNRAEGPSHVARTIETTSG